jgi:rhodanese-related sulfurtransferase
VPTELHRNDVQRLVAEGALLVDVLPCDEYETEHIAGAISIPLKELNRQTVASLDRDLPVIVYCYDYQ